MKFQEIIGNDWDTLIILDACRYDSLKEWYPNTQARLSRGSCTTEWLHKTFYRPMKDVIYISTNPFINSINLPLDQASNDCKETWNPTIHFKKVVDVWRTHWNDVLGTVHPRNVNEVAKKYIGKGRLIIHYVQPHEPYLSYPHKGKEWIIAKGKKPRRKPFFWDYLSFKQRILLKRICGHELSVFESFVSNGKINELKSLYEKNLDTVLEYVKALLPHLKGKTIITADHGEAFGENNVFGHPCECHEEIVRVVPWLEIIK